MLKNKSVVSANLAAVRYNHRKKEYFYQADTMSAIFLTGAFS
jgi:hypothetical protein